MTRQKGFTPILILVIILVVAGVAFVLGQSFKSSQSPSNVADNYEYLTPELAKQIPPIPDKDSIVDWKIYSNVTFGYSISYPSDWTTVNIAAGAGGSEALPNSQIVDIQSRELFDGNVTIQDVVVLPDKLASQTSSTEKIGTNTFTVYSSNVENMLSKTYYLQLSDDSYLEILMRPISDTNEAIFNEMISSLVLN